MTVTKRPLDPVILGVDIGNATTALAAPDAGVSAFFPSVVATLGVGTYEGLSKVSTSRHHIDYNDAHAVVGVDAFDMPAHDSLLADFDQGDAHKRYLEDKSLYCFLAAASSAFVDTDLLGVTLATGAPLSIYQSHADAIKRRYKGEHRYGYNGHRRGIMVQDVLVFGEGREVLRLLPASERSGKIAVHDLGGGTWNVLLFKDGALIGSQSFDAGVERLFRSIRSVTQNLGARWQLQQEMRRNAKAHPQARAELNALITSTLEIIERKVRIDKADRHLLIGGGAVYLPEAIKARYKVPAQILNGDAPEQANALAYALAAREVA